mgnify:CR=1 FL=1
MIALTGMTFVISLLTQNVSAQGCTVQPPTEQEYISIPWY